MKYARFKSKISAMLMRNFFGRRVYLWPSYWFIRFGFRVPWDTQKKWSAAAECQKAYYDAIGSNAD